MKIGKTNERTWSVEYNIRRILVNGLVFASATSCVVFYNVPILPFYFWALTFTVKTSLQVL